jgi:hypothetical protein
MCAPDTLRENHYPGRVRPATHLGAQEGEVMVDSVTSVQDEVARRVSGPDHCDRGFLAAAIDPTVASELDNLQQVDPGRESYQRQR